MAAGMRIRMKVEAYDSQERRVYRDGGGCGSPGCRAMAEISMVNASGVDSYTSLITGLSCFSMLHDARHQFDYKLIEFPYLGTQPILNQAKDNVGKERQHVVGLERQCYMGKEWQHKGKRREALRMYSILTEGTFKFEHCWDILKKNVKWCTQQLTKQSASKKPKSVEDDFVDRSHVVDLTDPGMVATENTISDGVARPGGGKAAKDKKKQVVAEKGIIDVLGQLQCSMEKQFEFNREELEMKRERDRKEFELREQAIKEELELKKARDEKELELKERNQKLKEKAQKRKDQERILNKDLCSMQPSLRKSFEELQKKILKEWEEDVLSGEAF